MTGSGCGWSKISRVRAPYDNLDPAVKPLQSPESAVYIMDSLLGGQWGFKNSRIPHFSRLSWLLGTTKWAEVELRGGGGGDVTSLPDRASINSTDQKGRFLETLLRFTQSKLVGGIRSTVASTRFHMTEFKADPTRGVHLVGGTRISPSNSRTPSDQVLAAAVHQG